MYNLERNIDNRKIDKEIAEKIYGLKVHEYASGNPYVLNPKTEERGFLPYYSQSLQWAFQIVDDLKFGTSRRDKQYWFILEYLNNGIWDVGFADHDEFEESAFYAWVHGTGETIPLAICDAALNLFK